ncbi:MAG: response regulator [Lachnospiraceae bacterium]|nr:response regulator [Lachnospiraceae bacterium]
MSQTNKSLVIVVLQYSVVVKGIERKLTDAGYDVAILADEYNKIRDLSSTTDLFLLYLPNDLADKVDKLEEIKMICDKIKKNGRNLLVIGEEKDRDKLLARLPVLVEYIWVNRPIEMESLGPAIEDAIAEKKPSTEKKRILIVDDDPSYAKMVKEWIKDKYKVDIVTAGMQAITFLLKVKEDEKVDLILLDYEMPVVDGPQVLQMLRQEDATSKIPVIFLTGVGTKEAVSRVMSLKPDGYVLKSTTRDNLLNYLQSKLKKG